MTEVAIISTTRTVLICAFKRETKAKKSLTITIHAVAPALRTLGWRIDILNHMWQACLFVRGFLKAILLVW